mgnify:CR=1 FL=1
MGSAPIRYTSLHCPGKVLQLCSWICFFVVLVYSSFSASGCPSPIGKSIRSRSGIACPAGRLLAVEAEVHGAAGVQDAEDELDGVRQAGQSLRHEDREAHAEVVRDLEFQLELKDEAVKASAQTARNLKQELKDENGLCLVE